MAHAVSSASTERDAVSSKSLLFIEKILNQWLKPELTAENFDIGNTGLLIESKYLSEASKMISTILLCNDLTDAVLDEAIELKTDLIISYHAPIFGRFTPNTYNPRFTRTGVEIATRCYNHDICLYSPHTALDSVPGGINDSFIWQLAGIDAKVCAVNPREMASGQELTGVRVKCTPAESRRVFHQLSLEEDTLVGFELGAEQLEQNISDTTTASGDLIKLRIYSSNSMDSIINKLTNMSLMRTEIEPYCLGSGRIVKFNTPMTFHELVEKTKRILRLKHVQVVFNGNHEVKSVAFAAGSGGYFIKNASVDVIITGEVTHTIIMDCIQNHKSIIMCGHTESERPYLKTLASILKIIINCPSILISKEDKSPISLM